MCNGKKLIIFVYYNNIEINKLQSALTVAIQKFKENEYWHKPKELNTKDQNNMREWGLKYIQSAIIDSDGVYGWITADKCNPNNHLNQREYIHAVRHLCILPPSSVGWYKTIENKVEVNYHCNLCKCTTRNIYHNHVCDKQKRKGQTQRHDTLSKGVVSSAIEKGHAAKWEVLVKQLIKYSEMKNLSTNLKKYWTQRILSLVV